jgi:hypothetical protein
LAKRASSPLWEKRTAETLNYAATAILLTFALFLGMLGLLEVGRRVGRRRAAADPEHADAGLGAAEGAVFGLMGLLIAFTFSGAATRFDARRDLIVQEANDIGTAYLRIDLLPAAAQASLRESFRRYVDSRLATYAKLPDLDAARAEYARSTALQQDIWSQAVAACRQADQPAATTLLLPALNEMIDITTVRTMAVLAHPPTIVFAMLFLVALVSSLLAGVGMAVSKQRNWVHMIGFAAVLALSVYVILDLEFPRFGLIRVDAFDQALMDVRSSMH